MSASVLHHRPLRVHILDLLFGDTAFSVGGDCSLLRFSLELLSRLEPEVDRALLDRSDWAIMSSSRTSNCGDVV
jgi:hypothetical protein